MGNKEYILTEEDMQGLHKVLLELLVEFDRICRKYNIIYSIDGGTLLGAIRHKGFIPWDDDADVILLRQEYEKFRKACEQELDEKKFYLQDIEITPGYRWGFAKIRRADTVCVRLNQEHMEYEQGIYLDIFVCDNVPQNYALRCICNFKSYVYRKLFYSMVGKAENVGIKKIWFTLLSQIPEQKLKKHYFRFVNRCNGKYSEWVKCLTFPARNRLYGFKREWYTDVIDIPFENVVLKGAREYDEYLKFMYGDYMEIPSEESRIVHAVSEFQLPAEEIMHE